MELVPIQVGELDSPNLMQSSYWAKLKEAHGWKAHAFHLSCSTLLVLTRTFSRHATLAYVPYGPGERVGLKELSLALRKYLPKGTFAIRYDLPYDSEADETGAIIQKNSVQPDATVCVPLGDGYQAVSARYRQRAKRQIKRAISLLKITQWDGSGKEFDLFYSLYEETARRDGFSSRGKGYMRDVLLGSCHGVQAKLFLAWRGSRLVGGTVLLYGKDEGVYLYGASARMDDCSVGYLLQDAMIRFCCDQKIASYDLLGVSGKEGRGSHLKSLDLFKTSFGGDVRYRRPTMDWPLAKIRYRCFTLLETLRYRLSRDS